MTLIAEDQNRLIIKAQLEPVIGSTIQPTGFPDLGAAEFERPGLNGSRRELLVESVQSMANHLEAVGWDDAAKEPVATLESLPYLRIVSNEDDAFLTSSRLEPHRLASAYVKDSEIEGVAGTDWITEKLGLVEKRPTDWQRIYRAVFEMDPLALIHGVFFSDSKWSKTGNPKIRRVTTAVVEGHNVERVVSGGLKRDDVQYKQAASTSAEEGYGFIPYGRTEYTAESIELAASVDLAQIRGFGLGESETDLLQAIALWELAMLLDQPLRLRTACDLEVNELTVTRPTGFDLPDPEELAQRISASSVQFEHPGPREARWLKG